MLIRELFREEKEELFDERVARDDRKEKRSRTQEDSNKKLRLYC
mgnify:CR=1 FL=1